MSKLVANADPVLRHYRRRFLQPRFVPWSGRLALGVESAVERRAESLGSAPLAAVLPQDSLRCNQSKR